MLLIAYQYQIEFRSTNRHNNADGLSRLSLKESHADENSSAQASKVNLMQLDSIPITNADLRQATKKDPLLSKMYIMDGQQKVTKNYNHICKEIGDQHGR